MKLQVFFVKEEEFELLGVEWAIKVLIRLRGTDFPLKKIEDRLKGPVIKDKSIKEIIEKMDFPVKNPAEVLYKIKK